VLRSLGRRGVHTIAISENDGSPAFWSRHCDERIRVPSPRTDAIGYRDALLALAKREDVKAIVPMREEDMYVLSHNAELFAEHVGMIWPSSTSLTAAHDRLELFEAAERAGVPVPETRLLTDVTEWDSQRIVKGRYALLGSEYGDQFPEEGFGVPPKTKFLAPGVKPDVDAIVDEMGHVPITQAFVDGEEYCMRALYHDGEAVATSSKRLVRGYKYYRGPSICHEAVDIPELEELGLALLDELDWNGMASVGFLRADDGTFYLLEINPRFPASLPMDLHAGVDYPWYYWELATTGAMQSVPDYQPGTTTHLLRGEGAHLHSVLTEENPLAEKPSIPGTVAAIATSIVRQPRFDHLDPRDPGPFFRDVVNMTENTVGGVAGSVMGRARNRLWGAEEAASSGTGVDRRRTDRQSDGDDTAISPSERAIPENN
jgi:hypothetical protein